MKKLIILIMSVLVLVGCSKKDTPLDQLFTEDSAFGVKRGMTYDELSKIISLEKAKETGLHTIYKSSTAPLQNSIFTNYFYFFNKDNKIARISVSKIIKDVKNGDGSKIRGSYNKITQALNEKLSKYDIGGGCDNPAKIKNGKLLQEGDNQNDYDFINLCTQNYFNYDPRLSVDIYCGVSIKESFESLGVIYEFE